jgi:hypothetical protein
VTNSVWVAEIGTGVEKLDARYTKSNPILGFRISVDAELEGQMLPPARLGANSRGAGGR